MERKTFDAVYRYGKLYDAETKTRILVAEGAKLLVIVNEIDILPKDPYNHYEEPRTKEAIEEELKRKKFFRYRLLAERDSCLQFQIKAGKANKNGKYRMEHTFTVRLLSELYMVQKTKANKYGIVYPASCVVESVTGDLPNFEPIYAYSLNDAYMKTYNFYFALFGKPTINIYNNYFLLKDGKQESLFSKRIWPSVNES